MSEGVLPTDGQLVHMLLSDVDPTALSIVTKGANGQQIFMRKSADAELATLGTRVLKKAGPDDDWSVAYVVVAEPGRAELPGMETPPEEQHIRDVWASTDEIRKAAHRFMHNGALVNRMHEDLEPYGKLVENAIAPCDLTIKAPDGKETIIKEGSWYVGIEPTAEGKIAIDRGEFTGVSLEGSGIRTPAEDDGFLQKPKLAKGTAAYLTDYDRELVGDLMAVPIAKGSSASLPDLDWSAAENWIDRLPAAMGAAFKRSWIYRAAKHLTYEVYGGNRGHAFAVAIEAARKGCATGDLNWPGAQSVNPGSRAEMCAAVQLWESMKATAKAQKLTKAAEAAIVRLDDPAGDGELDEKKLLRKVGEALGLTARPLSIAQRIELAKNGLAIPVRDSDGRIVDGRYPIENTGDLRSAIAAVSRGEDSADVKGHIAKLAKHLDQIDLLPTEWRELAKEAGTVSPVSETGNTGTPTTEERLTALESGLGELKTAIEPLAKLPGQIESLAKTLGKEGGGEGNGSGEGEGSGSGEGNGGEGKEPTAAELKKELDQARQDIAKLAAGESVQTGDELTEAEREQIAKAEAGGDGWEGAMLA